jgi:hypothetical protein
VSRRPRAQDAASIAISSFRLPDWHTAYPIGTTHTRKTAKDVRVDDDEWAAVLACTGVN